VFFGPIVAAVLFSEQSTAWLFSGHADNGFDVPLTAVAVAVATLAPAKLISFVWERPQLKVPFLAAYVLAVGRCIEWAVALCKNGELFGATVAGALAGNGGALFEALEGRLWEPRLKGANAVGNELSSLSRVSVVSAIGAFLFACAGMGHLDSDVTNVPHDGPVEDLILAVLVVALFVANGGVELLRECADFGTMSFGTQAYEPPASPEASKKKGPRRSPRGKASESSSEDDEKQDDDDGAAAADDEDDDDDEWLRSKTKPQLQDILNERNLVWDKGMKKQELIDSILNGEGW